MPHTWALRQALRNVHLWLGLAGGIFFCVLAATGGIVTFRPQIVSLLSPAVPEQGPCIGNVDWSKAERDVEDFGKSRINRIYASAAPDTRFRFRLATDRDPIFNHVIFDSCSGKVLGTASLGWMDWLVDFHHNLRFERTGRTVGGWFGVLMLLSAVGGIWLWAVSNPSLQRLLKIRGGRLMPRDLHTTTGIAASLLLLVASSTGI